MLGSVKTKKPRASLARFLPFVAVAVLVGIIYVFGDSLSKSVLESTASAGDASQEQSAVPGSKESKGGKENKETRDAEKPFETRVKSYNIDSTAAIEALLQQDAEERASEQRLEELLSDDVVTDGDGEDVYEFGDYAVEKQTIVEKETTKKEKTGKQKAVKETTSPSEENPETGAWDENEKTLVEADYDDNDDYIDGTSTKKTPKPTSTIDGGDGSDGDYGDYEDDVSRSTATTQTLSGKFSALEDTDDGEAFLTAMATCDDLICIQQAHAKYTRTKDMFNFPHFMIIGFQKAATTSLKKYLERHEQIDKPEVKEPNFFPSECQEKPPERCSQAETTKYIQEILHKPQYIDERGRLACMEASTHIVRAGHNLAPRMAKLMPWLKIIVQFREPISRAASMLIHNKEANQIGCLMKSPIGYCLLHHSQLTEMQKNKYEPLTYAEAIQPWIESFPKEQIHIIQYETLINPEKEAAELLRVKKFLGVDERLPQGGLEMYNARRFSVNPEGWQVRKSDYEELISMVEPDMQTLVDLLYDHDLLDDKQGWVDQWRSHWNSNLATCGADNVCTMALS